MVKDVLPLTLIVIIYIITYIVLTNNINSNISNNFNIPRIVWYNRTMLINLLWVVLLMTQINGVLLTDSVELLLILINHQ